MITQAASTFNGKLNDYLENVRKEHEQIIDTVNTDDGVVKTEWDSYTNDKAEEVAKDFNDYLQAQQRRDRSIKHFYNQPYNRRNITFKNDKRCV